MTPSIDKEQFKQLTQQLAGIELPPEPNWWPLAWTIAAVIIALLIISLIILKKNRTHKNTSLADQAPQRLAQIQQQWQSGELDQRATAYQLATLLRLGLGLRQLDLHTPTQLTGQEIEWQATIQDLQQLRYQPDSKARLNDETFTTIRGWLQC